MKFIKKLIKQYTELSIVVKASFCYLIINVLQKGLHFITTPIYTRLLSPDEYGQVSVYLSIEQMMGTIAMFCLSAGCFDVGMQDYKHDRKSFTFSIMALSNAITIVSAIIFVALYPYIGKYVNVSVPLLIAMFANFFLQSGFVLWSREQQYEYKYIIPGIVTIVSAIISSIFAILLICKNPSQRVEARVIGSFLPMAVIYIVYWIYVAWRGKFKINFCYWKFAFFFNLPLIPHYLSMYVLGGSDRIMIDYLIGEEQAAYYSLAYTIASTIIIIWSAVNSALGPYEFEKFEQKKYKDLSDKMLPILTGFAGLCMLVILFGPELIHIMGTDDYLEAIYVIPPVVGGTFFQALYHVFTSILYYKKRPQIVALASISTGILNVILNYIFIPQIGYVAAGYTTLFCYFIQAIIDCLVARKVVGQDIYDMKYMSMLIMIVIIVSSISGILYRSYFLRIGTILLFGVIVIHNRKKIMGLFQK